MRLGLNLGYWGLGLTVDEQLGLVKTAEDAGFDSVWAAEAYGSDAATVLAWLAGQTERIKLGSAIFQMPARSPAMTAMTAATLDHLSGGRVLLGIGSSGPQVAEGWHGQRFANQLDRTREYVDIVRKALARERLEYHGKQYTLPLPDGPGQGAQADDRLGAGAHPDLHRRDRAQEHAAHRRDRRRLDPDLLLARARGRVARAAPGGRRARRPRPERLVRHRAVGERLHRRRHRPRPRLGAAPARALRGRDGLAREELLQRARAPLRVRGGGADRAGPLPGRQEGRGRRGAAGRS